MSKGWDEVWTTFVGTDKNAPRALTLAKSIKNTFSYRKIIVLHGPNLSTNTRKHLRQGFDGLLEITPKADWMQNDLETYAKLHCWSLPGVRKCVFLSADSLVLKNCDELFSHSTGVAEIKNTINSSLMVLTPSLVKYEDLLEKMLHEPKSDKHTARCTFDKLVSKQGGVETLDKNLVAYLDYSYIATIQKETQDTAILQFVGNPPTLNGTDVLEPINNSKLTILDLLIQLHCQVTNERKANDEKVKTYAFNLAQNIAPILRMDDKEPIAIVGISCRLPGANDLEEFWNVMMNHGDLITNVPEDRWLLEQSCYTEFDRKTMQSGFLKCPVDEFDAHFFEMSPTELVNTDPQQRLMLEIAYEALEDAAIVPSSLKGTQTGIFAGISAHEYQDLMADSKFQDESFFRKYMGTAFGAASARIAHFLDVSGPNITTESGCSSSLVAVGLAMSSIRNGTSDIALACGVNLIVRPYKNGDSGIICPDGRCKTFDISADGFGRSEGVGVLVLKKLSQAVRDEDRIYGLLKGYGAAQEGNRASMGTPTWQSQTIAMERALLDANVDPIEVSFVELHGTGTQKGDPLEMHAITEVYSKSERIDPLVVGSVKANIGHTESCSGITSIIKTVLAFRNEKIPPHRILNKLNPKIDLQIIPAIIPLEPYAWKRTTGRRRLAGISSFGLTGTNAHVIIEEPPTVFNQPKISCQFELPLNIVTLSAKSMKGLDELVLSYEKHLQQNNLQLNDLAFTANCGRDHFENRVSIIGKSCNEILQKIEKRFYEKQTIPAVTPQICFLFTGQGSQYHGMGKQLYENFAVFRSNFDLCGTFVQSKFNISIRQALWGDDTEAVHGSLFSQLSIFVIEFCLTKLWESWGIRPVSVLGHSLGEFAAATVAGILTLEDALTLVGTRSKLINQLPNGKMLVVKASGDKTKELIDVFSKTNISIEKYNWLDIAAINAQDQTTVSGLESTILQFKAFCENNKIKSLLLNATHAFHSRMMDPMLEEYELLVKSITFSTPTCKFISGVNGDLLETMDGNYWIRHTREAVQFQKASLAAYDSGNRVFLEIGPNPVLSALICKNTDTIENNEALLCCPSMKKQTDNWTVLVDAISNLYLKGYPINWQSIYKFHCKNKISLPFYPFQRNKFWFDTEVNLSWRLKMQGKALHKLLGVPVISAASQKIFTNFTNFEFMPYISEYRVGIQVLFPMAAYLEISLVSSYAALFTSLEDFLLPETPIFLENLTTKSPFLVKSGKTYEVQTIVSLTDTTDNSFYKSKVCIYSRPRTNRPEEVTNWTSHSEASICCDNVALDSSQTGKIEQLKSLIIKPVEEESTKICSMPVLQKTWTNGTEFLSEVVCPENVGLGYLCHPVIIDAMLQLCRIARGFPTTSDTYFLPSSVKRFLWLAKSKGPLNYIHVSLDNLDGGVKATLYDCNGDQLASMHGVEFVQMSLGSLEKTFGEDKSAMVTMLKENWRTSRSMPADKLNGPSLGQVAVDMVSKINLFRAYDGPTEEQKFVAVTVPAGLMKVFQALGWDLDNGDQFDVKHIMAKMGVLSKFHEITRRFLEILSEDGFVKQSNEDKDKFEVTKTFPSMNKLQKIIDSQAYIRKHHPTCYNSTMTMLSNLFAILTGKTSVLSILFPETDGSFSAEALYEESPSSAILGKAMDYFLNTRTKDANRNRVLRVLEIGAGTGGASKAVLPVLEKHNMKYIYEYTDISSAFFNKAKYHFREYAKSMVFRTLNIEEDPMLQGYGPAQYDIIIAANVLHATRDLHETMSNVRHLQKNGGMIFLVEAFVPQRHIDVIFGLLEGYWRFTDRIYRPSHCLISDTKWKNLLCEMGYNSAVSFRDIGGAEGVVVADASLTDTQYKVPLQHVYNKTVNPKMWIVLADESSLSKNLINQIKRSDRMVLTVRHASYYQELGNCTFEVRPDSNEDMQTVFRVIQTEFVEQHIDIEGIIYMWGLDELLNINMITQGYLYLLQAVLAWEFHPSPKIFVITKGIVLVEDQIPKLPKSATLLGMSRSFRSEMPTMYCESLDLDPNSSDYICESLQIISELWKGDLEPLVSYRKGIRYVAKLSVQTNAEFPPMTLPYRDRYALSIPKSKAIADLKFGFLPKGNVQGNEIEVLVKATGLNIENIFNLLNQPAEMEISSKMSTDFSGIICAVGPDVKHKKIGDVVFGSTAQSKVLSSHLIKMEDDVIELPDYLTFVEGATLLTDFNTAYYCVIKSGTLIKGERVLINGASGAALCAIRLAYEIGAIVIATALTHKARGYLKHVGVNHVFDPKDPHFCNNINNLTNQNGVDMVVTFLSDISTKKTSLDCCRQNGNYFDMSNSNVWTQQEVSSLRPDVKYHVLNNNGSPQECQEFVETFQKYHKSRKFQPLPYKSFDALSTQNALVYFQKFPQIGKTVLIMPELLTNSTEVKIKAQLFNDRSTYLITGGLRGIGLSAAQWMVSSGAKHVVICGRTKPTPENMDTINELKRSSNIVVMLADVGNYEECQSLLDTIKNSNLNLPPLRGILHVAGTWFDATVSNQNWERFQVTMNPKVNGSWNLHSLTMDYNLEYFVLFSSVGAIIGSPGQSNYTASNAYLDALSYYRTALGLPATAVNWGLWGETGVAVNMKIHGFQPFSTNKAFNSLEHTIRTQNPHAMACEWDNDILKLNHPWARLYLSELASKSVHQRGLIKMTVSPTEFLKAFTSTAVKENQFDVILGYLVRIITIITGLEGVDKYQHFSQFGMDSLMMIELKHRVQNLIGSNVVITSHDVADCDNFHMLTNRVWEILSASISKDDGKLSSSPEFSLLQAKTLHTVI